MGKNIPQQFKMKREETITTGTVAPLFKHASQKTKICIEMPH